MLKGSKDKGKIHEQKIGGILTFNNKPKTRKVSYQEQVDNNKDKNLKYSYTKHYDTQMASRSSKRNSLKVDNIS